MPISDIGAKLSNTKNTVREKELLKQFAKEFRLLFFYKKSCSYCVAFADVLEAFSYRYGYKVAAVTLWMAVKLINFQPLTIQLYPANYKLITRLHFLFIQKNLE
ncbi:MAG: conjugal transfer protein TraF [Candidatus Midichloria sp.]|nr:conjugal transfer protein TraF [Candidatus Midichloria sp.]